MERINMNKHTLLLYFAISHGRPHRCGIRNGISSYSYTYFCCVHCVHVTCILSCVPFTDVSHPLCLCFFTIPNDGYLFAKNIDIFWTVFYAIKKLKISYPHNTRKMDQIISQKMYKWLTNRKKIQSEIRNS